MSHYEDYDETSRSYDRTRIPVGLEILVGCLAQSGRPLAEMRLLDAGCGTGNYAHALSDYVGHIDAVDINRGMIEVAFMKLRRLVRAGKIAILRTSIEELPFANESFDAVMVNQVLHHIEHQAGGDFPAHRRVMREFFRVLRPEGALVINTCSHQQLRGGFWYYSLIPEAVERMTGRYMPLSMLTALLGESGFTYRGGFVPLDSILWGEAYFDAGGLLKKEWRAGDSIFALVTPAELERACTRIRELEAREELRTYVGQHDEGRKRIGQVTFLFAIRN